LHIFTNQGVVSPTSQCSVEEQMVSMATATKTRRVQVREGISGHSLAPVGCWKFKGRVCICTCHKLEE